jgi:predicted anti-sigma-YlaC factor YlaD
MSVIDPDHLACQQIVEIVTDYMEGQLSSRDRTHVEEHLVICRDCTSYFQQMRWTQRLSAALGAPQSPRPEDADARGETANADAARATLLAAFRTRKTT